MDIRSQTTRRRTMWLLVFAAIAVLYLIGVVDAWYPTPDSALYQGLGRSLAAGRGYVFNGEGNTTVTPGLPAISGLIEQCAGGGHFLAKNLLMCLCGLAGLSFAYAALRRLVEPALAMAAVAVTALCSVYYLHSHLILTDAPFAMLFWAIVYCALRARAGSWLWMAPVAVLSVAAILLRLPGLTVLGPLAVAFAVWKKLPSPGPEGPPSGLHPGATGEGSPAASIGGARRLVVAGVILVSILGAAAGFYLVIKSIYPEPSAYVAVHFAADHGLVFRLGQFGLLLLHLPDTVGEIFTGRQGWWVWTVGCPLLVLVVVGFARQWHRGLRLPVVVLVLNVLTMVLTAGIIAAKARYYVPTLPLIALALLEGVLAAGQWIGRRRGGELSPRARGWAVALAVLVSGLANAPFLARATVYETALADRGRYHDAIAGGAYTDLAQAVYTLRHKTKPGQVILARPDRVNILHFLSSRVIEPTYSFGLNHPWNADQAETAYRDLLARPAFDWLVCDTGGLDPRYADRLTELLDSTGGLSLVWQGGMIRIYRRTEPLVGPTVEPIAPA